MKFRKKKKFGRDQFFAAVMRRAGITRGQVLPKWARALMLVLFPSRIMLWIGASVYDVMTDTIRIQKMRVPLWLIESNFKPSPPNEWYRVHHLTDDGLPMLEYKIDPSVPLPTGFPNFEDDSLLLEVAQEIVDEIIGGLLHSTCAHDEGHACLTLWSSGAYEQIAAHLKNRLRI